jgi:hypothetical protein
VAYVPPLLRLLLLLSVVVRRDEAAPLPGLLVVGGGQAHARADDHDEEEHGRREAAVEGETDQGQPPREPSVQQLRRLQLGRADLSLSLLRRVDVNRFVFSGLPPLS